MRAIEPAAAVGGRHRRSRAVLRDGSVVQLRLAGAADHASARALLPRSVARIAAPPLLRASPSRRTTLLDTLLRFARPARSRRRCSRCASSTASCGRSPSARTSAPATATAEVAFAVDDRFQGKGLGTVLLERLAALAGAHGFTRFEAMTLPDNAAMLEVFHESGFEIRFEVRPRLRQRAAVARPDEPRRRRRRAARRARDRRVAAAAARAGVRRRRRRLARRRPASAAACCARSSPAASPGRSIRSIRTPTSSTACAAIASLAETPARRRSRRHRRAARGSCSTSSTSARRPASSRSSSSPPDSPKAATTDARCSSSCVEKVRGHGMRMVGPNCMGLLNTNPRRQPERVVLADRAAGRPRRASRRRAARSAWRSSSSRRERGVGLSTFVSVGNKADVSGNDLLQYWEADPHTSVILLYLESFGNPRRFARLARRIGRQQADRRREGRTHRGGLARRRQPHRGARGERHRRRRAVPPVGRHPRRHDRRDVRHRGLPRRAAAARRAAASRSSPTPADPASSRSTRARRPGFSVAPFGDATRARLARVPAGRGQRRQPGRHGRVGRSRRVPPRDRGRADRRRRRRAHRHLHAGRSD